MVPSETVIVLSAVAAAYTATFALKILLRDKFEKMGLKFEGAAIALKTTKLNLWIEKIGEGHARIWRLVGDIGIVVGFFLMFLGIYVFHMNLINFLINPERAGIVMPVVPGITAGLNILPYFIIAVALILIPHELFHGFIATAHKISIKSAGIFLFILLPGGFVEPDEEKLKASSTRHQLRVYSAGSLANIITSLLLYLILNILISSSIISVNLVVSETISGYPAEGILKRGDLIIRVNNTKVRTLSEFTDIMNRAKAGHVIKVTVIRNGKEMTFNITPTSSLDGKAFIGVKIYEKATPLFLYNMLWLSAIFSLSVAVINIMPIYPLDGGQIIAAILTRLLKNEKRSRKISFMFTLYFLTLLSLNIYFSFSKWGMRIPWP